MSVDLKNASELQERRVDLVSLSVADQTALAEALVTPAEPNAALERAVAKAKELLTG